MIWITLIIAGAVFIGVPIVVALVMTVPMAQAVVTPIPDEFSHRVRIKASRVADDAEVAALGFSFEGVYEVDFGMGKALFVVWRHGRDATYLAAYTTDATRGRWITDLVSILSVRPHLTVTTSTAKEGHTVPPRAGDHMQTFDEISLKGLWQHHTDAEAHLAEKHGITPGRVEMPGGTMLRTYLRDSSTYRLQRPWVWLTVPYRYWIGKHLLHNRPITKRGV
ncbi:MAG: hypothetical protein AAGH99_13330 [Planctomycetota bacterium]